jgi:hypothetical protein
MRAFPLRVGVIDVGVMGTDYVERLAQRTAGALRSPTQMRRGPLTGQRPSRDFYAATAVCTAGMASVASGAPTLPLPEPFCIRTGQGRIHDRVVWPPIEGKLL